jgi:hypothetical protein
MAFPSRQAVTALVVLAKPTVGGGVAQTAAVGATSSSPHERPRPPWTSTARTRARARGHAVTHLTGVYSRIGVRLPESDSRNAHSIKCCEAMIGYRDACTAPSARGMTKTRSAHFATSGSES